jgi:hypothetical protein
MLDNLLTSPWLLAAAGFALLGVLLLFASLAALFRLHPFRFLLRLLAGLVAIAVGAFAAAVGIGTHGYQALTHETVAAQVRVEPVGPQRFNATLRFPDGRETKHELAGDEIYVDAHILKWKPIDLFNLRRRYIFLARLLDAEYGSASFVPVTQPAEFDVMISTTGVLIRERKP